MGKTQDHRSIIEKWLAAVGSWHRVVGTWWQSAVGGWRLVVPGGGGGSMVGSDKLNVPAIDNSSH